LFVSPGIKPVVFATTALALAGGIWLGVRAANPEPQQAVFESTKKDLGKVPAGEGKDLEFRVKNTGGKPLKIQSVTGTCGCLVPKYPNSVKPGETAVIQVRFEPAAQWYGRVQKELTVRTDDPKQPEVKLDLQADIDPILNMDPPSPIQLPVHRGATASTEVKITPRAGLDVKLSDPKGAQPWVKAQLLPPAPGDRKKSYRLKIQVGPCDRSADMVGTVTLRTTSKILPMTSVVAVALQLDGVVASPSEVLFSNLPSGQAGDRVTNFQVFTRGTADFKILSAKCSLPDLEPKVEVGTAGRLYNISLLRKGSLKSGRATGKLEIRTNVQKYPVLTVPIDVTVS
jgi:hypothetical protein